MKNDSKPNSKHPKYPKNYITITMLIISIVHIQKTMENHHFSNNSSWKIQKTIEQTVENHRTIVHQ